MNGNTTGHRKSSTYCYTVTLPEMTSKEVQLSEEIAPEAATHYIIAIIRTRSSQCPEDNQICLQWSLGHSWKYDSLLRNICPQSVQFHVDRALRQCSTCGFTGAQAKIGSRVGRNQTTVIRICDRWMQESTTHRRGRTHSPQCTTSREDKQIVCLIVADRSVTSRTVTQHIEFVKHHSVSVRIIQRRVQQSGLSARRSLLGLPLTQNL
ncbi:transposable element Tcb1 transposase [Trichonephila clavipes]|nr:transposable element Tcb1 transposase [Trichonephila clavipes]